MLGARAVRPQRLGVIPISRRRQRFLGHMWSCTMTTAGASRWTASASPLLDTVGASALPGFVFGSRAAPLRVLGKGLVAL